MEKNSGEMPYDPSKDPKRKPNSKDIGWRYGYWPDLNKRQLIACSLCGNQLNGGITRLKQHLAGGYGDVKKCDKTTTLIMREMHEALASKRKTPFSLDDEQEAVAPVDHSTASNSMPSSGTIYKKKKKEAGIQFAAMSQVSHSQSTSQTKIGGLLQRTPEEIMDERHSKGPSQQTIERSLKTKEAIEKVNMYVANFFYENAIPFNAANSRSYELMVKGIAQIGSGYKPPTYHELRVPLLKKAKEQIEDLKRKHEEVWERDGCTLMSDGWTDRRGRQLINFLVNSSQGTIFLGSVDASSQCHDAQMLADLLETKIDEIGPSNVVQLITDNGANYKAAGRLLEQRLPTLFWTPCAAHCLDLMLEDVGKMKEFKPTIARARSLTTFIYRHGRLLDAMREHTNGHDLAVEDCIRASQPLLVVLRIADGDEKPSMTELAAAMGEAKRRIKQVLAHKSTLCKKIIDIIESRWERQMETPLYDFNDLLEKLVLDDTMRSKILLDVDMYDEDRGPFAREMVIRERSNRIPLEWWKSFGGRTPEFSKFAKRIVSLCCSSSRCERNWSTFEFIHTKKRNRLLHQRLNDLVYVQYNRKIATRFQKVRECGKNYDPLVLDDFDWGTNAWFNNDDEEDDRIPFELVDEAIGASNALEGHNFSRRRGVNELVTYNRRHRGSTSTSTSRLVDENSSDEGEEEIFPNDDEDIEDDFGLKPTTPPMDNTPNEDIEDDFDNLF
ncbi:hypothetical protein Cni_G14067 [Canna indica]|uniref:BED-type domain-containing protein n=1 Tax=Canna indica TaxID=4628 RepID=A0AAQ3QC18_9LILI|nr:hypothetical protein Cni_G14067 [Canna indica]